MKSIIKNFIYIFRRFRTATILNILGLSVAFAAFMLIMMQVDFDYNYDKFHKDVDHIYRAEWEQKGTKLAVTSRGMYDYLISLPQVEKAAFRTGDSYPYFFSVSESSIENSFLEKAYKVSPTFADFFDFEMLEGSKDALYDQYTVLIPKSLAEKLFGGEPAVGKILLNKDKSSYVEEDYFIVGGVYKDFPKNSSIINTIYAPIGDMLNGWDTSIMNTYLKINSENEVKQVIDSYTNHISTNDFSQYLKESKFSLRPFQDIHFAKDVTFDWTLKTSYETILLLLIIAFGIIIIASINYTNFSIALVPLRISSVNIRKVLGGTDSELRRAGIKEAVFFSILSYCISLVFLLIIFQTPLMTLVDAEPRLLSHIKILIISFVIAFLVGLISGIYPSFYVTSFQPALVLKGSFGLSPQGRKLRSVLVGIQFVASFILIISSIFMYLQNKHIHNSSLGYDKEQLIIADLNNTIAKDRKIITSQLKKYSDIEDVSYSWSLISSADEYIDWGRSYKGKTINYQVLVVDPSFLDVLGIKVDNGRGFRESDKEGTTGKYIFNERARKEYDLELNSKINSDEIIGFIPDIQFTTFHLSTTPMALYVAGSRGADFTRYVYIRVKEGSNMLSAMEFVRKELNEIEPGWPFNARFYNDILSQVYEKDNKLYLLVTLFSIIAILISIIGVFGLVIFENEYRRKEIGIRKVLGSSIKEILALFSKTYVIILTVCFVLACPIVYYMIDKWLSNFTVRTPMYWWVFLLGGILIFLITIITVNWQSWRSATANPVEALKNE